MTTYKQVKEFAVGKMGKRTGYCLQNVRLGFGIASKYADAKAAMEACKKAGQFHTGAAPTNVAVPVWMKTTNKYGHIMVSDRGIIYSDGRKVNVAQSSLLGWGEGVNGVRVVEAVAEAKPAPKPAPAPSGALKVGDVVKITRWVDWTNRPLRQLGGTYKIMQLNGKRAVVTRNGGIYAAISTDNLARA